MDALIGHTGFVGSALLRHRPFDLHYNSSNIHELEGANFNTIVCAAAPGSMFEANRFPERDAERITAICDHLSRVRCRKMVLISTIAVLSSFSGKHDESATNWQCETPYGVNRRRLEEFCQDRFDDTLIVRLPALFGAGLKKNFLFDILNPAPSMLTEDRIALLRESGKHCAVLASYYGFEPALKMFVLDRAAFNARDDRSAIERSIPPSLSAVSFTNTDSTFQFYPIDSLARDLEIAVEAGLNAIHLAPEPLRAGRILSELGASENPSVARIHHEDMRTKHADLWSGPGKYIRSSTDTLSLVMNFLRSGGSA